MMGGPNKMHRSNFHHHHTPQGTNCLSSCTCFPGALAVLAQVRLSGKQTPPGPLGMCMSDVMEGQLLTNPTIWISHEFRIPCPPQTILVITSELECMPFGEKLESFVPAATHEHPPPRLLGSRHMGVCWALGPGLLGLIG